MKYLSRQIYVKRIKLISSMGPLRTQLLLSKSAQTIQHHHQIVSVGSCFAAHITERLATMKFQTCLNPHGIVFNPVSVAKTLHSLLEEKAFALEDLFEHNKLWHSFDHHGKFSGVQPEEVLVEINSKQHAAIQAIKQADWLICTFGTAYVFELIENGEIVTNCHKLPSATFNRRRLKQEEIVEALLAVFKQLLEIRPALNIILTLSPVRHIKDGLIENQRSKATLLLAIDTICAQLEQVHYFPSYELVLDDLRDYRFYNKDLVHPNDIAIDYVWEQFQNCYFDEETKRTGKQFEALAQAVNHRALHPKSESHQHFLHQQLKKIEALERAYPYLSLDVEKQHFRKQLLDRQ